MAERVLIIDDEQAILQALTLRLRAAGFEVRTAAGGVEGIEIARAFRPDVIALDLAMPDLNGWEVLKTLRSESSLVRIPVVILSAQVDEQVERKALDLGVAFVLGQPFEQAHLSQTLRAAICRCSDSVDCA